MNEQQIRAHVRRHYGEIVSSNGSCCGSDSKSSDGNDSTSCCSTSSSTQTEQERRSAEIGYSTEEMTSVPDGSNLGLGCGNPTALAQIRSGDTILDLGSGAGFDCFLAAQRTGPGGRVIGVDMTPDMLDAARGNAEKHGHANVEFRLGEIEHLPVADTSVDLIISNCVINLSPDKKAVFEEAHRVLRPGGRLMVSDIVLNGDLPESIKSSARAYASCVSGAEQRDVYLELIRAAGFEEVRVESESTFGCDDTGVAVDHEGATEPNLIASISVSAIKPSI